MKNRILFIFLIFLFFFKPDFSYSDSIRSENYYYFLRLQLLKAQQEYKKAEEDAKKIFQSLTNNEDKSIILFELTQLNFLLNNYEKSREYANKYLEINPDDNVTNIIIARSYFNENNIEKGTEQLENLLRKKKGNLEIFLNLMSIYTQSKNQTKAIDIIENTELNFINDEIRYYFLLLLYFENKDYEKTLFYLDKYITVLELDSDQKNKNIQSVLQILVELLDNNYEKDKIFSIINKLAEKDNSNSQIKIFYTQVLIFEKKNKEAIKILEEMQNQFIDNYKVSLDIFKLYIQADARENIYDYYKLLKEKYPGQKETEFFLATFKEKENQTDEAIKLYKYLLSDNNDIKVYENSLLRLTDLLRKINKSDEAIAILEKSYNETKSYFNLQLLLDCYFEEELIEKAENLIKAEMNLLEDNKTLSKKDSKKLSELKYNYFLTLDKKGKHQEAIDLALKELENDPNNPHLLNFIGYSYVEYNLNLDEAEKFLTRAIAINPNDSFITDSMGWLYYKQKKYDLAIDYLTRALKDDPDEPTLLEHLAEVYYARGDKEKALELFRKCISNIKKQNKDYFRVQERINSLMQQINN